MRNLKRVLSLTLASAMLFGMMVMGAGAADKTAADLTDSDKITNKEAVTLLVDLGIIDGQPDGSYAPAETVNRAAMAKLITVMMMGDVDPSAFTGTTTDLTDVDGHWAEGYIKYCYSNKIISGVGAGKFMPDEPVTTVAAAKMLLVATGYQSADRGYENNANWSVNIMKDAQSTKLYDGKTVRALTKGLSVKATDPLSRDNAAQMIFNALFVATQKAEYQWDGGKQYISKYVPQASMADTTYGGLVRVSDTLKAVDAKNGTADIGNKVGLKIVAKTGDIGASVVYYTDATTPTAKLVSSAAVTGTSETLATSTNGTSYTNLTTKGKPGYIGYTAAADVAVYYNGKPVTAEIPAGAVAPGTLYLNDGTNKDTTKWAENALLRAVDTTKANCVEVASKIGVTVEFYDNAGEGKYDTIKYVEYSFSQVSTVKAATATKEASVTLKGETAVDKSLVVGDFDNLKADDYVMYAKIGDQLYVYEPETFDGQMTAYSTSKSTMTISGTVYTMAATEDKGSLDLKIGAGELVTIAAKKDATFYKDTNGYIVAAKAVSADVNYAIVDKIAYVTGSGTGASNYIEAVMVFADGTSETVQVSEINDIKASNITNAPGKITIADSVVTKVEVSSTVATNSAISGLAVSYSVSDDKYELTYLNIGADSIGKNATTTSTGAASGVKTVNVVTKGVPTVVGYGKSNDGAASATVVANNNTTYLVKTGNSTDGYKFSTYTGFKNVPTITLTGGGSGKDATATVSYAEANGAVAFIYINAADTAGSTSTGTAKAGDMAYILNRNYTTDNSGDSAVYIFDAILNGEVGTISTKSTSIRDALLKGEFYELTVKDEFVTNATVQATSGTTYAKVELIADAKNGVVGGYTYDGTETVYVINDGELVGGTAESAKNGDTVYVKVVDKTTEAGKIAVDTIYIVKAAEAE